jgi:preprotein translocase subunit SecD
MKIIKKLFVLIIVLTVLWIDIPRNTTIFGRTINPPFNLEIKLGLDLKGGSHLAFEADTSKISQEDLEESLSATRDVIERRVNFFGVSEPSVQTIKSGSNYKIVVDLPGISNVQDAVDRIGQTAQLSFREIQPGVEIQQATSESALIAFKSESVLTGKDVNKAEVTFDTTSGGPQVGLNFTVEGAKKFAEITKNNVGKPVGIFLDEFILSAPVVQQEILDGNAVISGNFTTDEAKELAQDINGGALPIPIKLTEQRNIGPSLGAEEIEKSIFAGVVGLSAVLLFMVLYYGKMGLISNLALLIYGFLAFAIFKVFSVVLTLSGVAGFLLSIGMAVDSNILIFERIKEELRKKKEMNIAISLGFGRAIDAIKDANFTTLIVAFILFNPLNWGFLPQFGLVRGFALTLIIGVATSLFTGVFITKHLINFFYKQSK